MKHDIRKESIPSVYTLINRFRKVTTVRDWECETFIFLCFSKFLTFYSTSEWSHLIQFICLIVSYRNSGLPFFLHSRLLSDHHFTKSFVHKLSLTLC